MQSQYALINPNAGNQVLQTTEESNLLSGTGGGILDKYASMAATGHRLLIHPNPYNILIGYLPTKEFMTRMETQIPGYTFIIGATYAFRSPRFVDFLDDFLVNVLLPQMEERVHEFFQTYINGMSLAAIL